MTMAIMVGMGVRTVIFQWRFLVYFFTSNDLE